MGKYLVYRCAVITWPLGLAMWLAFFAIRNSMQWLLSQKIGQIAQGFNQGISAALTSIAWMVLATYGLAALASFVGRY
ncbi:hypothetical protein [Xanthomonas sp. BRIP62415]|uniref:hypothetical protein n=1 Tax=Xanthomonas sp. BRIP62415 TaxID=2182390 RepID=UPI000F8E3E3C|nr:hypothetical protein [Xanthomonas sp. BRIP62415]